jgi:hypothetical protein
MFHSIAEFNDFDIAVGVIGALCALSLLIFIKHFISLLWAIILGGVAVSTLLVPDYINYTVAAGCLAGLLLIVFYEVKARRNETFVRAEFERLSATVSELQNRNILTEIRMAGMRRPASNTIEDIESVS